MRGTFVLGLGCQKGGTSWLYDYLAESPEYAQGYKKEYHLFDCLDLEVQQKLRRAQLDRAARSIELAVRGESFRAGRVHWAAMYGDPDLYYDYFAGLLGPDHVSATGDLTPAYGMLSAERVGDIRRRFLDRNVRTVGIFLMRDPVERVWSQARMYERQGVRRRGGSAEDVVARFAQDSRFALRTRYDHTLRVLDEVFEPDDRFVWFYEDLFREDRLREVCDVAGIAFRTGDLETRSHASPKAGSTLPEDIVRSVAEHHREVYHAVAERFPEQDLAQLWPSSRFVL